MILMICNDMQFVAIWLCTYVKYTLSTINSGLKISIFKTINVMKMQEGASIRW